MEGKLVKINNIEERREKKTWLKKMDCDPPIFIFPTLGRK